LALLSDNVDNGIGYLGHDVAGKWLATKNERGQLEITGKAIQQPGEVARLSRP